MLKKLKKHKKILIAVVVITFLSLLPVAFLFREGFFLSDDGEWMVIRFSAFIQTLGNGQIPPRFFGRLNHGYGYPIGTFLYPAFMYIATPFKLVGLSYAEAIKSVIILSFVSSGIGSFLWLKHRFSIIASLIGAIIYVYFPYHLYDLYVRGSVGELVAFGVLPFLLFAFERKNVILGSLFYGLLILSHNTFAFLLTPFLLIYTYFQNQRRLFFAYPLGLLVSAFFWVPSLLELPLTRFSEITISDWTSYFLSLQNLALIGFIGLIVGGISIAVFIKRKDNEAVFFASIFLLSIFLASSFSYVLWQLGILPKLVQFPWRLLILSVWAASFLGAWGIDRSSGFLRQASILCIALAAVVSTLPYLQEYKPVVRDEGYYSTNEGTTTTHAEYMPKWVKKVPTEHAAQPAEWQDGTGSIETVFQNSNRTQLRLISTEGGTVILNKIYYPGWQAFMDGKSIHVSPSSEGYISLSVPEGEHIIDYSFGETPLRLIINIVSFVTVIFLLVIVAVQAKIVPEKWYNKYPWRRK